MDIYYFSGTGRSEKIAKELGEFGKVKVNKIDDNIKWSGVKNFLKAGAMSMKQEVVPIEIKEIEYENKYDISEESNKNKDIILVFPIWAGNFPPAVRTFLKDKSRENIIIIPTSLKTVFKDTENFKNTINLIGKDIEISDNIKNEIFQKN